MKIEHPNWEGPDQFPLGNRRWELMRTPWSSPEGDKDSVINSIQSWDSFDPLIVATPDSKHFLPPICVPDFSETVHRRMLMRQKVLIVFLSALFVVFAALAVLAKSEKYVQAIMLLLLFMLFVITDYVTVIKFKKYVQERAMFVHWLFCRKNWLFKCLTALMFICWIVQLWLQSCLGSQEQVVIQYGVLFSATERGEWWRYLVGPFIHSSFAHWLNNLVMLSIISGVVGAIACKRLAGYFVSTMIISTLAVEHITFSNRADALVGISGGICVSVRRTHL